MDALHDQDSGWSSLRPQRSIVSLDACPIEVELTEPFSISAAAPNTAQNVLVRVVLRDGSVGYGEAAPFEAITGESQASTFAALVTVAREMIGRDAAGWRALSLDLRALLSSAPAARCAVEQAVVDAFTRHLRLPLIDYFGGGGSDLITDVTIPAGDIPHSIQSAVRAAESGFRTVKVKIGATDWEADVDRILAIDRAAPGLSIIVDANAGYSLMQARHFLRGVNQAGVTLALVEQPVAAGDIDSLAIIEREFGIPVCADESVREPADAIRIACAGGISTLNVKLMKCGVVDALDIMAIARSAGMSCMMGGMIETTVSMTFSAALAAANHTLFKYVDLDTPLFMAEPGVPGGMIYNGQVISLPADAYGTGVNASGHFSAK